ncbi:MAG: serine/threonine protein kinase, partial [Myxococcota bacterium]|nr:serine/threonine protein kinase [Myxococcota bacterium]
MSAPQHLAPGTIVGGRYRVVAPLGAGTMGCVHRAVRVSDGKPVALKIIPAGESSPQLVRRLEREAKALGALAHRHALAALDLGEDALGTFLVTELVPGASLESMLRAQRLAPELALAIADQILSALAHAHALGILHRDVKPENVVVAMLPDGTPHARLLDFGLAKFHDREAWGVQSMLTSQGAFVGTPAYLAPEQVFGPSVDERSDVYSAGVVLFELLTGSWPFVAEEIVDVLRAHALEPVPTLAGTRPELEFCAELEALVARALAKKPRERFVDAGDMRVALSALPRPAAWPSR